MEQQARGNRKAQGQKERRVEVGARNGELLEVLEDLGDGQGVVA